MNERDFVDATDFLRGEASCLDVGEVVSCISLFEAMSALEMMDSKMDAGMLFASDNNRILSVDDAIKRNLVKTENFEKEEIIGILDELVSKEVTWLDGQSLAQTLFTSMYIHRPTILKEPILYSFCLATLKCHSIIHNVVMRADVCKDEDFQLRACYPQDVIHDLVPNLRVIEMLGESITELKNSRSSTTPEEQKYIDAIIVRLEFRQNFLRFLLAVVEVQLKGFQEAKVHVAKMKEVLVSIKTSIDLGIKIGLDNRLGFEESLNYKQLNPAPASKIECHSREKSFEYFSEYSDQVQCIVESLQVDMSYRELDEFFYSFSLKKPCVLASAILFNSVWQNSNLFGQIPLSAKAINDLNKFIRPYYADTFELNLEKTETKANNNINSNNNTNSSNNNNRKRNNAKGGKGKNTKGNKKQQRHKTNNNNNNNNNNSNNNNNNNIGDSNNGNGNNSTTTTAVATDDEGSCKSLVEDVAKEITRQEGDAPSFSDDVCPYSISDFLNSFFESSTLVFETYFKIRCFNRARQHRKLSKLLTDLAFVQQNADSADLEIYELDKAKLQRVDDLVWDYSLEIQAAERRAVQHQQKKNDDNNNNEEKPKMFIHCIGTWTLSLKIDIMMSYLLYGFELDLYAPYELSMIYWYLDNLFGWKLQTIRVSDGQIQKAKVRRLLYNEQSKAMQIKALGNGRRKGRLANGNTNNDNKKNDNNDTSTMHVLDPPDDLQENGHAEAARNISTMILEVKQTMCQGMFRILQILKHESRLRAPSSYFDDERERYAHRFQPFFQLQSPLPLNYEYYINSQQQLQENDYEPAIACFASSKQYLEIVVKIEAQDEARRKEQQQLLKICKTNAVVLKLLKSGHKAPSKPTFDFSVHPEFPIISL